MKYIHTFTVTFNVHNYDNMPTTIIIVKKIKYAQYI
jgi:hypothetical protein